MKKLCLLILISLLCACSRSELPPDNQEAFSSPTDPLAAPDASPTPAAVVEPPRTDDIELRFAIPQEQIDGFVIYYGFSADNLSNEVKVPVAELEIVDQPAQGKVYRYILRELPAYQSLFVSLAAYRGDALSARTDVIEIAAGLPIASVGTAP